MDREIIAETLKNMGLSCTFEFVPFSSSRNKDNKQPSLNYQVMCLYNGKLFLTTEYTMGCAHVPGYRQNDRSIDRTNMIREACERGYILFPRRTILPNIADVYYSIVMDSDVLDYGNFENWAAEFGYDSDSIKAEKLYRMCLDTALIMRAVIGDSGLERLREVYRDY